MVVILIKRFSLLILLISLALGCRNQTTSIDHHIQEQLEEWDFQVEVNSVVKGSKLRVRIFFKSDESENLTAYFIDEESNRMLVAMLNERFYTIMKDYDIIAYDLDFDNPKKVENIEIKVSNSDIENTHERFSSCPTFYEFVIYTFKTIKSVDVVRANAWLDYLQLEAGMWDFNGSYWDLLYAYAKACDNPETNLKSIYHFVAFAGLVSDPTNPKDDDIDQQKLKYFINYCNLDSKLMNKSLPELFRYLEDRYSEN